MKCSQTDCLSSEKEKRNLNHREKWFLEKRDWKMITRKRQNFTQKNEARTEILQIWLEMGKHIFLFLLSLSTFSHPEKLNSWYEGVRVHLPLSDVCSDWNDFPCTLWGFSSWPSVWILEPVSLFASDFSFKRIKQSHTCCNRKATLTYARKAWQSPASWPPEVARVGLMCHHVHDGHFILLFTQIDHTIHSHRQLFSS